MQYQQWEIAAKNFLRVWELEALRIVKKAMIALQNIARDAFYEIEGSVANSIPKLDSVNKLMELIDVTYSGAQKLAQISVGRSGLPASGSNLMSDIVEICNIFCNLETPFAKFSLEFNVQVSVKVDAKVTITQDMEERADIKLIVDGVYFYLENITTPNFSIRYTKKEIATNTTCVAFSGDRFAVSIEDYAMGKDLGMLFPQWETSAKNMAYEMAYVLQRLFTSWEGYLINAVANIDDILRKVSDELSKVVEDVASSLPPTMAHLFSQLYPYIFVANDDIELIADIYPAFAVQTNTYIIPLHARISLQGAGLTRAYNIVDIPLSVKIEIGVTEDGKKLNYISVKMFVPNPYIYHPAQPKITRDVLETLESVTKSEDNFSNKPLDISTYRLENFVTYLRNRVTSLLTDSFVKLVNFIYSNVTLFASTAAGGRMEDIDVLSATFFTNIQSATEMSISSVMSSIALGVISSIDIMDDVIAPLHSTFYDEIVELLKGNIIERDIERETTPRLWSGGGVRYVEVTSPSLQKTMKLPPMWLGPSVHARIKALPASQKEAPHLPECHVSLFFSPAWVLYPITARGASNTLGGKFVGVVIGVRCYVEFSPIKYKVMFIETTHSDEMQFRGVRSLEKHSMETEMRNISMVRDVFTRWWQQARSELQQKGVDLQELIRKLLAQVRIQNG